MSARIAVIGLWHLGCVVAAGLARLGHHVTGTDFDRDGVHWLQQGIPPIYEPHLGELLTEQMQQGRLSFTPVWAEALASTDFIFVTFDTPVDENDHSDLTSIESAIEAIASAARGLVCIVLMSQVPVGTCRRLDRRLRERAPQLPFAFAYQPENLRLGGALQAFFEPEAIVLGVEQAAVAREVSALYAGIEALRVTMSWESAELAKHARNAFLATSISFANEVAGLAETCGADMRDVVRVLRLDRRIGPEAFVNPGPGFSGGTLARDLEALRQLGQRAGCLTTQLDATAAVNASRLTRILEKVRGLCGELSGLRLGLLGLTYKPGTNTLRRSHALALARRLVAEGCDVHAHDPQVCEATPETAGIALEPDAYHAAQGSDVLLLATPWPEFRQFDLARCVRMMRQPVLIDLHNCLDEQAARRAGFRYFGVGIPEPTAHVAVEQLG